ncbi:hypothetical protein TNCV_2435941 [Trichonephila clavipes]|nr:hypothetical protein TNCV_2435941 [Trichonephila clavipes]
MEFFRVLQKLSRRYLKATYLVGLCSYRCRSLPPFHLANEQAPATFLTSYPNRENYNTKRRILAALFRKQNKKHVGPFCSLEFGIMGVV